MAIMRRVNWVSQIRADLPAMRSIESAVSNDFDTEIQAWVTGTSQGYIMRGFNILMGGAIGNPASSLQLQVDPGAVLHIAASQSGTILMVPEGTPSQVLNSATNTNVTGGFTPSSINYVTIDYIRYLDTATDTQDYIWSPSTNSQITTIAPAAEILTYVINISTATPTPNQLTISSVLTDSSNNVLSVTDDRWMFCSLSSGGISPNLNYSYPWTQGRVANPETSTSDAIDPFSGGDKNIGSLKELLNAIMTTFKEIKGTPQWFNVATASASLPSIYQNAALTLLTGGYWFQPELGHLALRGIATVERFGLPYNLTLDPFGPVTATEGSLTATVSDAGTIVTFSAATADTINVGDAVTIGAATAYVTEVNIPNVMVTVEPAGGSAFSDSDSYAFSGTIAGTSTAVVITANNIGPTLASPPNPPGTPVSNSFTLTFTGSNTITSAIATWNAANPTNLVTLTSGNGSQTPSVGSVSPNNTPTYTSSVTLTHYGAFNLTIDQVLYIMFPSTNTPVTYTYGQDGANPIIPQQVTAVTPTTISVPAGGNYITTGGNLLVGGLSFSYSVYAESAGTGTFSGVIPNPTTTVLVNEYVYQLDNAGVGYYMVGTPASVPGVSGSGMSFGAERVYWLAYYDGSSFIYIRNGQLGVGEGISSGDTVSTSIMSYIGQPSQAISVPTYSSNIRGIPNENLTARIGTLTDAIGDEQEDRSAYFYSTSALTWDGSTILFTSNIVLYIINAKTGGTTTHTISASAPPYVGGTAGSIPLTTGQIYYIEINRANASETITGVIGTSLPAQIQATKDIIPVFQCQGSDLIMPFHKQTISSGDPQLTTFRMGESFDQYQISGTLQWVTDNTYNIGEISSSRPANIYVGTSIAAGGSISAGTTVTIGGGPVLSDSGGDLNISTPLKIESGPVLSNSGGTLDISSSISVTGSIAATGPSGNITASENITANGNLIGNEVYVGGLSGPLLTDSGGNLNVSTSLIVANSIYIGGAAGSKLTSLGGPDILALYDPTTGNYMTLVGGPLNQAQSINIVTGSFNINYNGSGIISSVSNMTGSGYTATVVHPSGLTDGVVNVTFTASFNSMPSLTCSAQVLDQYPITTPQNSNLLYSNGPTLASDFGTSSGANGFIIWLAGGPDGNSYPVSFIAIGPAAF
jgi:hypothetical protein